MQKTLTARDAAGGADRRTPRARPALRWNAIRQVHVYLSVFVAPSLIFFALTGALQTFRIPDLKAAPVVVQKLARLHKDDVFAVKPAKPPRPAKKPGDPAAAAAKPPEPKPAPRPATEALKWFFATVSVMIAVTTSLGLWMALAYYRRRGWIWGLAIAGTAIPVALLALAA